MSNGWTIKKLGDVCSFDKTQGQWSGLPYVGMEDVESGTGRFLGVTDPVKVRSTTFKFTPNHILYGRLRPYLNKVLLPDFEGHCSTEIFPIKTINGTDRRYLFHWLLWDSTTDKINATCTGARMPRANMNEVLGFGIPIPPIAEQKRIVAILDEAFEAIDKAKQNAEKNLQNARDLFESHLQSVFTQRGDGWMEINKPLAELCKLIVDCEHKTAPTQAEGIPSIRTPNIGKGKLVLDGVYRVSEQTYRNWTRRAEPKANDLILAREAPAGNVAVIPENLRVCLGQRTVLIRPDDRIFDSHFLAALILQPDMRGRLLAHSTGATVQHVNMKDIRALRVGHIPSLSIQKQIVAGLDGLSGQVGRLESVYRRKLAALEELKKSLLHRAFSGKLLKWDEKKIGPRNTEDTRRDAVD